MSDRRRPGEVRDAIRDYLGTVRREATVGEIQTAVNERLGSVQHITSFWRYRFPILGRGRISADELVELLADFEASLSFEQKVDRAA